MVDKAKLNRIYKGNSINQPIKKKGFGKLAGGAILSISLSLYIASPRILNIELLKTKPVNESKIEQIINQTRKEYNSDKKINFEIGDFEDTVPIKNKDGSYTIRFKTLHLKEGIVRHELYHILAGHIDTGFSKFKYQLIEEPTASIYAYIKTR